jgi:hypothetical protein
MLYLVLLILSLSPFSSAKRSVPAAPADIIRDGMEYSVDVQPLVCKDEARKECHEEVIVSAKNKASGEERWKTMILQVNFDGNQETDVQTMFPTAMKLIGRHQLVVTVEDQARYILNAQTGDMIRPSKTAIFESKKSK